MMVSLIEHLVISCYRCGYKMTNWPSITIWMIYTLMQQDDRIAVESQIVIKLMLMNEWKLHRYIMI